MSVRNYVRYRMKGATYFFTVVTFERQPILTTSKGIPCLRQAFRRVKSERPFETLAICILPDHLHVIWKLPLGDDDFSTRWRFIKSYFTRSFTVENNSKNDRSASRARSREQSIWQRRFWERLIRDDDELRKCMDYVHFNPLKHGLIERLSDYPWSSFHRYVQQGIYDRGWGGDVNQQDAGYLGE